jgi:phosphopantothenoylcysteine decarboxylase/phosphopantothenate--cysteine ligase
VVMTPSAEKFVGPLTFRTLTGYPVFSNLWEDQEELNLTSPHIHLAEWAEIFFVAPCTADTLARLATGRAENALDAVLLSARCPIALSPAMDLEMYRHPAVLENIRLLRNRGIKVLDADSGQLASGLSGEGRLPEPEVLFQEILQLLGISKFWSGKSVLITAGPTREKIDPVRFISNYSSGKMGYALAQEASKKGASVTLISGPVNLSPPTGVKVISTESAAEMLEACLKHFPQSDITIMSAAVADYRPADPALEKIKKQEEHFSIPLIRTTDILKTLGQQKQDHQILIGFALETYNEAGFALQKLDRKNLDMVVMNSLRTPGAGFGVDTNQVTLFSKGNKKTELPLLSKQETAIAILKQIEVLK